MPDSEQHTEFMIPATQCPKQAKQNHGRVVHMVEGTFKKQEMVTTQSGEAVSSGGGRGFWGAGRLSSLIWG